MARHQFECGKCEAVINKDVPVSAPLSEHSETRAYCPSCKGQRKFSRIYGACYLTAGMLTKKYTGQAAATAGWGTHNLDYGKAGSDLVAGRARELAENVNGHKLNEGRPLK